MATRHATVWWVVCGVACWRSRGSWWTLGKNGLDVEPEGVGGGNQNKALTIIIIIMLKIVE